MVTAEELEEIEAICQGAKPMTDGPLQLIHMVDLVVPTGGGPVVIPEALLCLSTHEGYLTRLFLSQRSPKELNWTIHTILGKAWHTWSWQGVQVNQRLAQILAEHLRALR